MNLLDVVIIVIVLISVVTAAAQGFFFEIFSLAGTVIGYLVAAWSYRYFAPWFLPYVKNDWVADGAAFLVIFILIVILAGIIGRITRWFMQEVGMRWFDRFLGAVFGALRGALVVMAIVMAMATFSPGSTTLSRSSLAPYFLVMGRGAMWVSPSGFREKFRAGLEALRQTRNALNPLGQQNSPKSSTEQPTGEKK